MYELNFHGGVEQVWRLAENGYMGYFVIFLFSLTFNIVLSI